MRDRLTYLFLPTRQKTGVLELKYCLAYLNQREKLVESSRTPCGDDKEHRRNRRGGGCQEPRLSRFIFGPARHSEQLARLVRSSRLSPGLSLLLASLPNQLDCWALSSICQKWEGIPTVFCPYDICHTMIFVISNIHSAETRHHLMITQRWNHLEAAGRDWNRIWFATLCVCKLMNSFHSSRIKQFSLLTAEFKQ
jgi:hypothetical protein